MSLLRTGPTVDNQAVNTTYADIGAGDWVPLYEALCRSDKLNEMREAGFIWGGWDWQALKDLQTRCANAGLQASIGFHEDFGYYLERPGSARSFYRMPAADKRCMKITGKHLKRAKARGHRPGSWREIGSRAAYCCDTCGDRLYVDVARNLVCGELTTGKRCHDGEANPTPRRWLWRRR